jgi:GNAT superfamily N-acetyltransferase
VLGEEGIGGGAILSIRPLVEADIPAAQRLREQAGWNQSDDDWRRLLGWGPAGCWVAEQAGAVVGTTAVTAYGRRIAWVGMVLVDVEQRRQGIGRALLEHALAYLEQLGVQTIALDSTPAGQPLYARLGFVDAFGLERWRGPIQPPRPQPSEPEEPTIRPLEPADVAAITAYDAPLFGVERGHILGALVVGHPDGCFLAERRGAVAGYVLTRPGARALHVGPLAADDERTATRLVWTALLPHAGQEAVLDVMSPNRRAVTLAEGLGLAPIRPFIRMTRGAPPPVVNPDHLFSSAGPELG